LSSPDPGDYADLDELQQGFATNGMGLGVSLHGSNPKLLMSALGQKQTWTAQTVMSALPPKADIAETPLLGSICGMKGEFNCR
jgi:hypothetical protein